MKIKIKRSVLKQAIKKTLLIQSTIKDNYLLKVMQDQVKSLFSQYAQGCKSKGQPASPQVFNNIIQERLQQGGEARRQYSRLMQKLSQIRQKGQYKGSETDVNWWRSRNKGYVKGGQTKPQGIKVGKQINKQEESI